MSVWPWTRWQSKQRDVLCGLAGYPSELPPGEKPLVPSCCSDRSGDRSPSAIAPTGPLFANAHGKSLCSGQEVLGAPPRGFWKRRWGAVEPGAPSVWRPHDTARKHRRRKRSNKNMYHVTVVRVNGCDWQARSTNQTSSVEVGGSNRVLWPGRTLGSTWCVQMLRNSELKQRLWMSYSVPQTNTESYFSTLS